MLLGGYQVYPATIRMALFTNSLRFVGCFNVKNAHLDFFQPFFNSISSYRYQFCCYHSQIKTFENVLILFIFFKNSNEKFGTHNNNYG